MKSQKGEKGGFVLGMIVGLLIGLALALGVALYVTKVPVPFVNKVPQRTPEQEAAEAARNKNWDPNAPLAPKTPIPPMTAPASAPASGAPAGPGTPRTAAPGAQRDPATILSGQAVPPAAAPLVHAPKSAQPAGGAFSYFVQVGAFGRAQEAEQQRARLAMLGMSAKVTEREQSGRTVYRVRVGPFARKEDADAAQQRLQAASFDAALVRVDASAQ